MASTDSTDKARCVQSDDPRATFIAQIARMSLSSECDTDDYTDDSEATLDSLIAKARGLPAFHADPMITEFIAWFDKAYPEQDDDCAYLNGGGWDDLRDLVDRARGASTEARHA